MIAAQMIKNAGGQRHALFPLLVVGLCCATVFSVDVLRPRALQAFASIQAERLRVSERCLQHGEALMLAGRNDEAFEYLQLAVANAATEAERIAAGLAMGKFLLGRAESGPERYAKMAEQYLLAVVDSAADRETLLSAHKSLLRCALLTKEFEKVARHAGAAVQLVDDGDTRAELLLSQIDASIELGAWEACLSLVDGDLSCDSDPKWHHEFAFRQAVAREQILLDPSCLQQWLARQARDPAGASARDGQEAESLRKALLEETLERFRGLADSGVQRLVSESLFRMARLHFHDGQYGEARAGLYDFFSHEPRSHQAEALLMMTTIARREGRQDEASRMVATFLKRFSWNAAAAEEFFAIADSMEQAGRIKETLELVESYRHLPGARAHLPELLNRAGRLAKKLGDISRSEVHFEALLEMAPRDEIGALAMLELASLRLMARDDAGAQKWLVKYLNRFPYDTRQGDAFFMLLEILRRRQADGVEVISAAIAAADRNPEDERTAAALMDVARTLENMGLPSLAGRQYSKLALLQCMDAANTGSGTNLAAGSTLHESSRAVLGNARCLLKSGKTVEADHLLRELCNSLPAGPVRSEAAYCWATIALKAGQKAEAARRLQMVDATDAAADIAARAAFEEMVLQVSAGKRPAKSIDGILNWIKDLPGREHTGFVRKAYLACFDVLKKEGDIQGMKGVLAAGLSGPHRERLPLLELNMRLAEAILKEQGVAAFSAALELGRDTNGVGRVTEIAEWKEAADAICASRERLDRWMSP